MTTADTAARIPEGAIVSWTSYGHGVRLGIVTNIDPVLRIGRLSHYRPDGSTVIYDPDGIRAIVNPADLTVLAEQADAGWAVWTNRL